jgi:hypothetical protein
VVKVENVLAFEGNIACKMKMTRGYNHKIDLVSSRIKRLEKMGP